jgi:hypothetical protein
MHKAESRASSLQDFSSLQDSERQSCHRGLQNLPSSPPCTISDPQFGGLKAWASSFFEMVECPYALHHPRKGPRLLDKRDELQAESVRSGIDFPNTVL